MVKSAILTQRCSELWPTSSLFDVHFYSWCAWWRRKSKQSIVCPPLPILIKLTISARPRFANQGSIAFAAKNIRISLTIALLGMTTTACVPGHKGWSILQTFSRKSARLEVKASPHQYASVQQNEQLLVGRSNNLFPTFLNQGNPFIMWYTKPLSPRNKKILLYKSPFNGCFVSAISSSDCSVWGLWTLPLSLPHSLTYTHLSHLLFPLHF